MSKVFSAPKKKEKCIRANNGGRLNVKTFSSIKAQDDFGISLFLPLNFHQTLFYFEKNIITLVNYKLYDYHEKKTRRHL